jgi:hypothetical protein
MNRLRGGETTGGSSARVERHFGDVLDEVAVEAPLSRPRLVRGLAVVDQRGRIRDDVGERAHDRLDLPAGVVYVLPVDEWSVVTDDLLPVTELAVRETHRRLARALADDQVPPRTDPLVVLSVF